ncbi:REP-associated tyrosine transposase [Bermanella sp. WJH001]|uniref:REP-associated tyrosine transposase n=1 Tax=Bermanella sp. WJH001 TaxID=3048005 RepID=UPI0024BDC621|nr:transposase [Bermanella sp. WJH001]MDJ1538242.1 transposase [Bermanella sp. WJH001]
MSSYKRNKTQGGTYFFTLVLKQRHNTNLLIDHFDLLKFSTLKVKSKSPFKLPACVVMPDHLHMIMSLPKGDDNYAMRIRLIKTFFSKSLDLVEPVSNSMSRKNEKGVWQRRFWEHLIRDEQDLQRHIDYIHYNPVKHGYCNRADEWPYSTFHNYVERGMYSRDWACDVKDENFLVGE